MHFCLKTRGIASTQDLSLEHWENRQAIDTMSMAKALGYKE